MDDVLIRNDCAIERINPLFMPLVEAARAGMVACFGGRLRELRLQGSIARGDARVGHADLDMLALLDQPPTDDETDCLEELAASLGAETQVVSRLDLAAIAVNRLEPFRRFVLSSDSLCIHGADSLTLPTQSVERLALARLVTPDPESMLPDYLHWAEELAGAEDEERRFASRIIGKDLLKVLRGVLLLRGAEYKVAIQCIAGQTPTIAPETTDVAKRLYALYAEPTTDVDTIRQTVGEAIVVLNSVPECSSLCGVGGANIASLGEAAP